MAVELLCASECQNKKGGEVLSPETLRRLLQYTPETGELMWLERPDDFFVDGHQGAGISARNWNKRYAFTKAFSTINNRGYLIGQIKVGNHKKMYRAHRVIWAMHWGKWPAHVIDHISGDTTDNRLENLGDCILDKPKVKA